MPAKKKNAFVRYFTPFGLRQLCDMIMLSATIILGIGLIIFNYVTSAGSVLIPTGLILFILGSCIAIFRSARVMLSGINRRSPEFRHALVNIIIMAVMLALAVCALLFFFFGQPR